MIPHTHYPSPYICARTWMFLFSSPSPPLPTTLLLRCARPRCGPFLSSPCSSNSSSLGRLRAGILLFISIRFDSVWLVRFFGSLTPFCLFLPHIFLFPGLTSCCPIFVFYLYSLDTVYNAAPRTASLGRVAGAGCYERDVVGRGTRSRDFHGDLDQKFWEKKEMGSGNGKWGEGGFFACILEMFPAEPEMLLLLPLCGAPSSLSVRGAAAQGDCLCVARFCLSIHPTRLICHLRLVRHPSEPSKRAWL